MSKELWAAVALTLIVTMSSVLGAEGDPRSPLRTETSSPKKAHIKSLEEDIESGCIERFNPYQIQYSDTAEQDICTS